jgi:molybdopterin converting factor small subunit
MADTVTITVKLFAMLKKYLPPGKEGIALTLPKGSTVQDAIAAVKIPPEHAGMLVADDTYVEVDTPLIEGMQLSVFPPLAGGVCCVVS